MPLGRGTFWPHCKNCWPTSEIFKKISFLLVLVFIDGVFLQMAEKCTVTATRGGTSQTNGVHPAHGAVVHLLIGRDVTGPRTAAQTIHQLTERNILHFCTPSGCFDWFQTSGSESSALNTNPINSNQYPRRLEQREFPVKKIKNKCSLM